MVIFVSFRETDIIFSFNNPKVIIIPKNVIQ